MNDETTAPAAVSVVIAMKGHPGTGKSTLAKGIAAALKCPLIDKDDIRDCTYAIQMDTDDNRLLLNQLCYDVIWRLTSTQLELGLTAVVVDSPLSRRAHLDRLVEIASERGAKVVVVECRPGNEAEWRRRVDTRNGSWHKPSNWEEMEKLIEGYGGCWDYDVGEIPKLVADTTADSDELENLIQKVIHFISHNR